MSIDVQVEEEGFDEVIAGLGNIVIEIEGSLTLEELTKVGERILELARQSISIPYPPASAPFEAPRMRTGDLRDSLQMIVDSENLRVIIGTDIGYGKFLELGTSRMQARPFLLPALLIALIEFKQNYPERIRELKVRG